MLDYYQPSNAGLNSLEAYISKEWFTCSLGDIWNHVLLASNEFAKVCVSQQSGDKPT